MKATVVMLLAAAALALVPCGGYRLLNAQQNISAQETSTGAARGKALFARRCAGCHSLNPSAGREGPPLRGVYGRKAGAVTTFKYSPALQSASVVWNQVTLESWLTDPDLFIPGNAMDFHLPDPGERADIVRFLKASSDQ